MIYSDFVFKLGFAEFADKLMIDEDDRADFEEIFERAVALCRPKAICVRAAIEEAGAEGVRVGGVYIESGFVAQKLSGNESVYPFVITSGREMYDYYTSLDDPIMRYWLEMAAEDVLRQVIPQVFDRLRREFGTNAKYTLNPGSLKEWPISGQKPLFRILGDVEEGIGVRLKDSMLMVPEKSVSGILFYAGENFENCQLCPRENCPSRRKPYQG